MSAARPEIEQDYRGRGVWGAPAEAHRTTDAGRRADASHRSWHRATLEQLQARRRRERWLWLTLWSWCALFSAWLSPFVPVSATRLPLPLSITGSAVLMALGLGCLRLYQHVSTVRYEPFRSPVVEPAVVAEGDGEALAVAPVADHIAGQQPPPIAHTREAPQARLSDRRARVERVQALVANATDLVFLLDADGYRREVSPTSYRILGYPPEALIGTSLFRDVHPEDLHRVLRFHLDCLGNPGAGPTLEFRHRDATGDWRDLEVVVNNLLDDVVASLVLTCRDVTVRRATEASLAASEARFRALVQHATDLILVVDADGVMQYASPAITFLLGYQPEEVSGTAVASSVHPEDQAQLRAVIAAPPGAGSERPVPREIRMRHRGGDWRMFEVVATNLLQSPGVGGIVINARDITERKAAEAELTHRAFTDALTGLPNRARLRERLAEVCAGRSRAPGTIAVLFVDLDRFKIVNDSLGHAAGDALLIAVSQRLLACLRPGDMVARMGGDEFAVLLPAIATVRDATGVATRIIGALAAPVVVAGHTVATAASVGIALHRQEHGQPDELLQDADVALYRAKAAGRGCFAVFDPAMNAQALERLELEADLRDAVVRGELRLYYQPEVDLGTGDLLGVEALVRWAHPRRGLIPPAAFIPLAEETGLIVPIGRWILETACRQAAAWVACASAELRPITLGVNLSARQLQQLDIVEQVRAVLAATGLPPACLRLEITESVAMQQTASNRETLGALKALGVTLAIDDFGTGYSSLSYLRGFPVDTIKIDRSFVEHLGDDAGAVEIVQAIAMLARALKLEVVVEGVETQEQLDRLQMLACARVQGHYFARPLPPEALETLLLRRLVPHHGIGAV